MIRDSDIILTWLTRGLRSDDHPALDASSTVPEPPTEVGSEKEETEFRNLLSMPLASLTEEQVASLEKKMQDLQVASAI